MKMISALKSVTVTLGILFLSILAFSQPLKPGRWKAALLREDGHQIDFIFDLQYRNQKPVIYIINAEERLEVSQVKQSGDSVFIEMPFFESSFYCKILADGSLRGRWVKGTSKQNVEMDFLASPGNAPRFPAAKSPASELTGRWSLQFYRKNGEKGEPAIAELNQKGKRLTGSILTPTGDYRYLEGVVTGDSMFLSTFDGSHAYSFSAFIKDRQALNAGKFYSGANGYQTFTAYKNDTATLSMESVAMYLKPDQYQLDFRFRDLNGQMVGVQDQQFRNKVVVIQIMGSWCPNCMDESRFLSEYYRKNQQRGVEMIALAYEYSTNEARSKKSLQKFQERFSIKYPILLTGVTSGDSLRTEKTLPQLTPIKSFPSTIFIGRDGNVKKVVGGFFGPATGDAYTEYVQEFEATVEALLVQ